MNKLGVILIFSLMLLSCNQHAQKHSTLKTDSKLKIFSDMWKTDSLGLNGFRSKNYSFIQDPKHWAIGGVDFRGYSKQELIEILGKPNESGLGKEDELLIMSFILETGKEDSNKSLLIYFDKNNNVDSVILKSY